MLYFSKLRIISVIVFTVIFSYFAFSNFVKFDDKFFSKNINLGLDLQGGSYLLLEVDNKPIINQKLQTKLIEIKKVVKEKGFNLTNIVLKNETIILEIKNDLEKIINFFDDDKSEINPYYPQFKTHQFNLVNEGNTINLNLSDYGIVLIKNATQDQAIEIVRRRVDELGTNEPNIVKRGNDRILVELPGLDDPDRIKSLLGKTANLSFQFVSQTVEETFGNEKLIYEDSPDRSEMVSKRIILSGENLIDARPSVNNQNNETVVVFNLDRVGAKKFGKATSKGVGRQLAIVLDNKIISAPTISEAIIGGSGQITGDFTFQSATDLALLLRSGALPAPLNIIEERTVGPDLGKDSIKAGIISLIIGFILVVLFMIYKYKIFGLIANVALITNLILLIGILSIFEATLTLPGIAGIILTVGMAVDANVLIFERIKEESLKQTKVFQIVKNGFDRAMSTILDANITTLIAAVLLFAFGSGPIRGFSITLSLGVIASMFTALMLTNFLVYMYLSFANKKELKL